jgi:hypothetical protein
VPAPSRTVGLLRLVRSIAEERATAAWYAPSRSER